MKTTLTVRDKALLAFNDYVRQRQASGELPEVVCLDESRIRRVLDCWTVPWYPEPISRAKKRRRAFCGCLVFHPATQTVAEINRPPAEGIIRHWRDVARLVLPERSETTPATGVEDAVSE